MVQLATRMRPKVLTDVIGQEHLTGPDGVITKMANSHMIGSMIIYGPPGTGKTSIAHALSGTTGIPFHYFNASTDPKKKLQDFAKDADPEKPIIILLDEIHRLDKPKQDFLLPFIEDGSFIIVGATTENPYINVTPALRSRTQIVQVFGLSPDDIKTAIETALIKDDMLKNYDITIEPTALDLLITRTNGDVRHALNALEFAINVKDPANNPTLKLETADVEQVLQQRAIAGDKDGDAHYDLLSAFQKSIRGSDVDASLHYLARLLESGDLISAVRRILVITFEDIGLANPDLWTQAIAATNAAQSVGLPEAVMPLSAIVVQLALSPKSNASHAAYANAMVDIQSGVDLTIPPHLRDAHYKGAKNLGHGQNYKFPHDYPYAAVKQQYLPDSLIDRSYLNFKESKTEEQLDRRYKQLRPYHKD